MERVKRQIKVWQWFTARESYVHKHMVKFSGHPENAILGGFRGVGCTFLKMLMVSDKMIHRASRIPITLQTKPIRDFFFFYYLPKLYFVFKDIV